MTTKVPTQCALCRNVVDDGATTLKTTDAEKAFMVSSGAQPDDTIAFCNGCRVVLSDPEKAATVMRGLCKLMLSRQPVAVSDRIADQYEKFILEKAKPTST